MLNPELALTNQDYADLYMRYLGTLRTLGELASRCGMAEVCLKDEVEAVADDAEAFLDGCVKIIRHEGTSGFTLDVVRHGG